MMSVYKAQSTSTTNKKWVSEANNQEIVVSPPKEFGGEANTASPEHLYALSLLNCYIATVKVIAEKSNYALPNLNTRIEVHLDTDKKENPLSKATITLNPTQHTKKLQHILKKAKEHCYVHHSVKTKIEITVE